MRLLIASLVVIFLAGCAYLRATEEPIPTRWHVSDPATGQSDTLVVFLPGIKDTHDDIFDYGAIHVLEQSGLDWDAVTVDAHIGYYRQESFLDRLEQDVFATARDRGYDRFWLTGPSLGGFGSLFYACRMQHDDIDGVIAMAPHLGGRKILTAIRDAGGPEHWSADEEVGEEHERQLWTCLRDLPAHPEVWLAYGERDDLAPANAMLADLLPEERVHVNDGDHLWSDWIPLWERIFADIAQRDSGRSEH